MTVLRKLVVALGFDSSEYNAGLEAAAQRAEEFSNKIGNKLSSIGGNMQKAGLVMSAGITAPLTLAATQAISSASSLEESMNKVNVVFEDSAAAVQTFATNAAADFGMTEQSALEAAGTFGNLFYSMGIGMDTNADMSTSLITLAADLASFNNMDPTEVLDKLRAGLTGETEPLKRLGVNLNATTIEAKAMQMGLISTSVDMEKVTLAQIKLEKATAESQKAIKLYGADSMKAKEAIAKEAEAMGKLEELTAGVAEDITPAAKAQAAYALILEQTTKAQGDFERTSDGTANQMRILKATTTEIAASFGKLLLPIITSLVPKIVLLLQKFENMSPAGKTIVLVILAIAAAIGPLLMVFGTLLGAIGSIATFLMGPAIAAIGAFISAIAPILLIIAAIVAAVLLFKLAWDNNFLGIRDTLTALWENSLKPAFEAIGNWLGVAIPAAAQFLSNVWNTVLLPAIVAVWGFVSTKLFPLFMAISNFLGAVFGLVIRVLAGIWQNILLPALTAAFNFLKIHLQPAFDIVSNVITTKVVPALQTASQWFKDHVAPAIDAVGGAIDGVIGWINRLTNKLNNIKLPKWMTPGSPTPWENGLVGISKALRKISAVELPRLSTQLDLQPQLADMNSFSSPYSIEPPELNTTIMRNTAVGGNDSMIATLKELIAQPFDEKRLARSIRDAILAVT